MPCTFRPHFRVEDRRVIASFMQQFDFVALVTNGSAGLVATHVPVLIREAGDDLQIVGHLARGNPHWRLMDGQLESMAIFQGPHAYVSPTWYASSGAVPTWNYAVVHAYGPVRIREDAGFIAGVVEELTTALRRRARARLVARDPGSGRVPEASRRYRRHRDVSDPMRGEVQVRTESLGRGPRRHCRRSHARSIGVSS